MQRRCTIISSPLLALGFYFVIGFSRISFADQLELPQKLSEITQPAKPDALDTSDLTSIRSALKLEIIRELKQDENVDFTFSKRPRLNFLELSGYLRTRGVGLGQCDLGTYIPSLMIGSSQCAPVLSYFSQPSTDVVSSGKWHFSGDVRFRLEPTLNVSEDIRIRGRVDFLDNTVLGSNSHYMTGTPAPNAAHPIAVLAQTQTSPLANVNSDAGPIAVKQIWGEVSFPYGEFRFGRLPLGFGLGILFNSGNGIEHDYSDNVDGAFFETSLLGHQLTSGLTVSYSGPIGRGGGLGVNGDNNNRWGVTEEGARLDLDPSDNVYNVHLLFESDKKNRDALWHYGAFGTYRFQYNDTTYTRLSNDSASALRQIQHERNAHLGLLSLWTLFKSGTLVIEAEGAGIFGLIANGKGLWSDPNKADGIWIYQGGIALESRYGFMGDRLQVGVDAGWASGDPAPGFGVRPGLNPNPQAGAADGQQYGGNDNAISNFVFNRNYHVDTLLFREVIGAITDAFYLKPHIAYFFTEGFGLRADAVGSMSNFARSTPGNDNILGIELDASMFFKTKDGFHFSAQYGHLFPFNGLNLDQSVQAPESSRTARSASALRFLAGISF